MSERIIRAGGSRQVRRWVPDSLPGAQAGADTLADAAKPLSSSATGLETMLSQAREQGYAAGLAAGLAQAREQLDEQFSMRLNDQATEARLANERAADATALRQAVEQWAQSEQTLREASDALLAELPALVTRLALAVARRVLRQAGPVLPDAGKALADLLEASLQPLQDSLRLQATLSAHPDTLALLSTHVQPALWSDLSARCRADERMDQGGFVLRHPDGEIDLSLPARWRQTVETFCADPAALNWN